ncbi:MAG TPA: hypothetical protein ENN39_12865 [Desulfonatronum sp.]|nr:hypothetical protein [Desulfonatronum sp.]
MNKKKGPGSPTTLASALILIVVFSSGICTAEDLPYDLDFPLPEIQASAPVQLGGTLEFKAVSRLLDRGSLLYKQRYADRTSRPQDASEIGLTLKPEFSTRGDPLTLYLRPRMDLRWNSEHQPATHRDEPSAELFPSRSLWSGAILVEEAVFSIRPSHGLSLDAGKKVVKWGKGYAWSPTAFAARPKDVDDPDKTREGYVLVGADWIRSMDGLVTTLGLNPLLVPVDRKVNTDLADRDTVLFGGKLSLLAWDTDIDLLFLDGHGFDQRLGLAAARNLAPHFVVHGELALRRGFERPRAGADGTMKTERRDAVSLLLGLRYVNRHDTTFILEYLHNGEGYGREDMRAYHDLIASGAAAREHGKDDGLLRAGRAAAPLYNKSSAMRDYVYLRIIHKEPFNILYFTPALTVICNTADKSLTLNPEVVWSPRQNLELKAKLGLPMGRGRTEFGEKMHHVRAELTLTRYF